MFVRVVVNAGAGVGSEADQEERRAELNDAFTSAGADCEVEFVPGEQLERSIQDAAEAKPDAVVIAGGDGSLGTAASILAGGDIPLGVIPTGTFNHFAKDLGIPLEIDEAASAIVEGNVCQVDVGWVNGRCFVNNSSIGVYPVMVALRDRMETANGWGKLRAVPVASYRVLRRFPARRMSITADGFSKTLRTPLVFIGNNRYEIGPRGLGKRESIAGGQLWVYVANAASRLRLLWMALMTMLRGPRSAELSEHGAPEITITAGSHRLRVALDGEVVTLRSPLRYEVAAGALAVFVPEEATVPSGRSKADASGADADPG